MHREYENQVIPTLRKKHLLISWINLFFKTLFKQPYLNAILFSLTLFTTFLTFNIAYSVSVVSILLVHEMGHYLMCRRHGVRSTLPFFIPIPPPFSPFGTMGAVIKMEGTIPNRKALFDVGVAGPLAGLVVTIFVLIIGLQLPPLSEEGFLDLGHSILYHAMVKWLQPELLSNPNLFPNPVAFAGWVGLFITALNLLPIGQLDGGHIVYSLFGRQSKYVYRLGLLAFTINAIYYPPWVVFLILLTTFGLKHPPPLNDVEPVDVKRKIIGIFTFGVFILSFMPFPFDIF